MPDLSAVHAAASAMKAQGRPDSMVDAAVAIVEAGAEHTQDQLALQNALTTARELAVHVPPAAPIEEEPLHEG